MATFTSGIFCNELCAQFADAVEDGMLAHLHAMRKLAASAEERTALLTTFAAWPDAIAAESAQALRHRVPSVSMLFEHAMLVYATETQAQVLAPASDAGLAAFLKAAYAALAETPCVRSAVLRSEPEQRTAGFTLCVLRVIRAGLAQHVSAPHTANQLQPLPAVPQATQSYSAGDDADVPHAQQSYSTVVDEDAPHARSIVHGAASERERVIERACAAHPDTSATAASKDTREEQATQSMIMPDDSASLAAQPLPAAPREARLLQPARTAAPPPLRRAHSLTASNLMRHNDTLASGRLRATPMVDKLRSEGVNAQQSKAMSTLSSVSGSDRTQA